MKTFMKALRVRGASLLGMAALVTLAVIFVGVPQAEPEPSSEPALQITTHTSGEIVGRFKQGSSNVLFESRMETSQRAAVQVRVNDLLLDASGELEEGGQRITVIIDGYGKALLPEDKRALMALTGLLEQYLEPYKQQLPLHEGLLMATVAVSGEAPAGYKLIRREIQLSR